jgi:hypothetical protein
MDYTGHRIIKPYQNKKLPNDNHLIPNLAGDLMLCWSSQVTDNAEPQSPSRSSHNALLHNESQAPLQVTSLITHLVPIFSSSSSFRSHLASLSGLLLHGRISSAYDPTGRVDRHIPPLSISPGCTPPSHPPNQLSQWTIASPPRLGCRFRQRPNLQSRCLAMLTLRAELPRHATPI